MRSAEQGLGLLPSVNSYCRLLLRPPRSTLPEILDWERSWSRERYTEIASEQGSRLSRSTAPPCLRLCWKANSSGTREAHLQERNEREPACSKRHLRGLSFWLKLRRCHLL